MSHQADYQEKLTTIDQVAQSIKSGDRILSNSVAAMPITLVKLIENRYQELENVELFASNLVYPFDFLSKPEVAERVHYNSSFVGPLERNFVGLGLFNVRSCHFSRTKELVNDIIKPNIFMTTVSPMDENGYFNLGPMGVSQGRIGVEAADKVIVQVNKNVPRVRGIDTQIHISEVDVIFEHEEPLPEVPEAPSAEIDKQIAKHVLSEIEDGSTVQIGFGGLSGAVSYGLLEKKNLSVHTEMITESVLTLTKEGVITGPIVGAFAMGSRALYEFAGENEKVTILPIDQAVEPYKASRNHKLISINTCLMVDLTGQVVSEGSGTRTIGCTGGALDFCRAAQLSEGGKSFFCLTSTHENSKTGEKTSNIRFSFPEATPITIPRADTDYIATEYGVAHLRNQSVQERVKRMIAIAHPDFREELTEQAKAAGYLAK